MITREELDQHLPAGMRLADIANRIIGLPYPDIELSLQWLARVTEEDYLSSFSDKRPTWTMVPGASWGHWSELRMDGLQYKRSSHYLTAEGWPTGTTCWFVRIECGMLYIVCAENPTLAVQRAVVLVHLLLRQREIEPRLRPDIWDMVDSLLRSTDADEQ